MVIMLGHVLNVEEVKALVVLLVLQCVIKHALLANSTAYMPGNTVNGMQHAVVIAQKTHTNPQKAVNYASLVPRVLIHRVKLDLDIVLASVMQDSIVIVEKIIVHIVL